MILADVYSELGAQLETITGLRVYPYPADAVQVPAAILGLSESISFDLTYQRGGDRIMIPLVVLTDSVIDRTVITDLSPFLNGAGASSVKAVLEAGVYTAFDFVHVASAQGVTVEIGTVRYHGATFTLDVVGPGE